jgi:DNA invertase Pin-like site-specific DNA recombinase
MKTGGGPVHQNYDVRPIDPKTLHLAGEMYKSGQTFERIAAQLGVSKDRLRKHLRKIGVVGRNRSERRMIGRESAP